MIIISILMMMMSIKGVTPMENVCVDASEQMLMHTAHNAAEQTFLASDGNLKKHICRGRRSTLHTAQCTMHTGETQCEHLHTELKLHSSLQSRLLVRA